MILILLIFFLLDDINFAVKTIKAKRAKSDVVNIFFPPITKNLLVEPALKIYANNITIHDMKSICFEYCFNQLSLKLYTPIIAIIPIATLDKCLYRK